MATKAKTIKPQDAIYGMVLYADGSAAPTNPGFGGWGIHGYSYAAEAPKKGSGHTTQVLTSSGYVEKAEIKNDLASPGKAFADVTDEDIASERKRFTPVKPLFYVDGYGSFGQFITNNVGELQGAANAFAYASDYDIKKLTLLTDSDYVVKGSTKWLTGWKKNNWIKTDGQPVANKDHWLTLSANLEKLQAKGVTVDIKWVKGHAQHMGNQLADKFATIGNMHSRAGIVKTELLQTPADGYWAPKVERHPFISHRRLYFTTLPGSSVVGQYHLGEHGKDDELLGKRMADGAYSFVRLAKPEVLIEKLRDRQTLMAQGADAIIMARLDVLYKPAIASDIARFGDILMYQPSRRKLDLNVIVQSSDDNEEDTGTRDGKGAPLTKELNPPRLAMRAIDAVNTLHGLVLDWEKGAQSTLAQTIVTDVFYDRDEKNAMTLKAEFVVGFSTLTLKARYDVADPSKEEELQLFLGVDLPDRNVLKRLEGLSPTVYVVTWKESETSFRHATLIKAGEDVAIWAGMYSNLRFLSSAPVSSD